jgi:hypothetical protein
MHFSFKLYWLHVPNTTRLKKQLAKKTRETHELPVTNHANKEAITKHIFPPNNDSTHGLAYLQTLNFRQANVY